MRDLMAELRITQFYDATIAATGPTDLYTVPAGRRIIVKRVTLLNTVPFTSNVWIGTDVAGKLHEWAVDVAGSSGGQFDWPTWIILNPGEKVRWWEQFGITVNLLVGGTSHFI